MIDALFGSKTRVKLLHLFLNNPNRAFYVREITRKIDEQINSVRRELANMVEVGIVRSEESNNKLYYEVDQTYSYYGPLKQIFADKSLSSKAAQGVDGNDGLEKQYRLLGDVRVMLYSGKLVHGASSKVDILIAGNVNKAQVKKLVNRLEKDEGQSLSYVVMDYQDFYYRLSIKDQFVNSIINSKHAVIIDTEHIFTEG